MAEKKKRHCLTWTERLQMEALLKAGVKPKTIAEQLGFHFTTIYREIHRGKTVKRNSDWTEETIYSPDLSQREYDVKKHLKGPEPKIGNDHEFVRFVEDMVLEKDYSPAATLAYIDNNNIELKTKVCLSTLYNYIRKGIFLNLTIEKCPYHRKKKKKTKGKVQKRKNSGTSIEQRPEHIDEREEFGHWEMDTVIGKSTDRKSLLVLTERKTRYELVELLPRHTAEEVVKALDRIERFFSEKRFRAIFQTITVDNGTEFSDADGIARSRRNKRKPRTTVYYCHPYSSYERGSNENINKMVRRKFPKGETMKDITRVQVAAAQEWINEYPRKILGYRSSKEAFQEEIRRLELS